MSLPALILASGASRRLGFPKQQALLAGETLLHRAARLALEAGCSPVGVVLGCEREALADLVADLPVGLVPNPAWEEGMASSIRAGLGWIPGSAGGLLLMVCDQVRLEADILRGLLKAFRGAPDRPAACAYEGILGVPAVFPRSDFPRLAALRGDTGARALLRDRPATGFPWPEGARDLDEAKALESGGTGRPRVD